MKYREIAKHVLLETAIWACDRGFHEGDTNSIAKQHGASANLTARQMEKVQLAMRKEVQVMFDKAIQEGIIMDGQTLPEFKVTAR